MLQKEGRNSVYVPKPTAKSDLTQKLGAAQRAEIEMTALLLGSRSLWNALPALLDFPATVVACLPAVSACEVCQSA